MLRGSRDAKPPNMEPVCKSAQRMARCGRGVRRERILPLLIRLPISQLSYLVRQFECEAVLIDARIAEKNDLYFVKFAKAFSWAVCDVALFEHLNYDVNYATDHFFRDQLREICDSCVKEGAFLGHEELRTVLNSTPDFDRVFRFFDGLKKNESRLRWDRLVAIHLLLMAFVNCFGYDMQESTQ